MIDHGQIVERGTHDTLLGLNGLCADPLPPPVPRRLRAGPLPGVAGPPLENVGKGLVPFRVAVGCWTMQSELPASRKVAATRVRQGTNPCPTRTKSAFGTMTTGRSFLRGTGASPRHAVCCTGFCRCTIADKVAHRATEKEQADAANALHDHASWTLTWPSSSTLAAAVVAPAHCY